MVSYQKARQVFAFLLILLFVLFFFLSPIEARQGCCSWHGGVCGCDTSVGRQVCCDGSYSPSCTCPHIAPTKKPDPSSIVYPTLTLKPKPTSIPRPIKTPILPTITQIPSATPTNVPTLIFPPSPTSIPVVNNLSGQVMGKSTVNANEYFSELLRKIFNFITLGLFQKKTEMLSPLSE